MPSLRFYNVISIFMYAVALALLYASFLPIMNILFYFASVSLNLVPHLVKYEVKGVELKGVRLFPSKHYMGLYSLKTGKILISSKAVDMPDVFLFIKYHEAGHSRQPHDLLYYVSRNLSPFALALYVWTIPPSEVKYNVLFRLLASLQLALFALQFTGPAYLGIVAAAALLLSPAIEHIGDVFLSLAFLCFWATATFYNSMSSTFAVLCTSVFAPTVLFYMGYTVPSLAYEIDADNYAAKMMGERVLTAYKLFIGVEPDKGVALLYLPFLLFYTHPPEDFEYFRLKRFVKGMKERKG